MKTLLIIVISLLVIFLAFQFYLTWSTAKVENQKYELIKQEQGFEIRFYPSVTLAQITSSAQTYKAMSSPGFRKLAGFIFGKNQSNTQIAMTSPVQMDINDKQSSMSFVMPSVYNAKELPMPLDTSIKITQSEDEYVAAIHFGGFADDKVIERCKVKLKELLLKQNITPIGNYRFFGYNPPFQLLGRRNEIIVRVDWQK